MLNKFDLKKLGSRRLPGRSGDRTSANDSGARCARTTASRAMRGITSAMIRPAPERIAGGRTGSRASPMTDSDLCFALALWNGKDPILKERLFGLTNSEGNHGEDVKEYYFYLDSTPTHSYMKYLYKYPQSAYPYDDLVETNRRRSRQETRVRAARHGRLRSRSLLRCLCRICQGVVRKTSSSGSPCATVGRSRQRCMCFPRSGSATIGQRGFPDAARSRCSNRSRERRG